MPDRPYIRSAYKNWFEEHILVNDESPFEEILSKMASIGVIIPNFNQGGSIAETIESILSQTVLPDEIVVIDDASTDDSVEIIRSLSSEVPILRLIRNKKNRGVSYCMNLGTREAQSDLIIYRAADDVFIQNAISNAQKAFQA